MPEKTASKKKKKAIYYFVGNTVSATTDSAAQQLTRQLGGELLIAGEEILFVKWDADSQRIVLLNREDLECLQKKKGPTISAEDVARYPASTEECTCIDHDDVGEGDILFMPEMMNIASDERDPTLSIMMEGRRLGLELVYVHYDAIPLKSPEYASTCRSYERYMQALLLVDLILPVSDRSAADLRVFLQGYQRAQLLPSIQVIAPEGDVAINDESIWRDAQGAASVEQFDWKNYARKIKQALSRCDALTRVVPVAYYYVESSSGKKDKKIRQLASRLATGLNALGMKLIPVRWNATSNEIEPASEEDIRYIAEAGGPVPENWITEKPLPAESGNPPKWLIMITDDCANAGQVVDYAHQHGIRCAAIAGNAQSSQTGSEDRNNPYIESMARFDKILAVSDPVRQEYYDYILGWRAISNSIDHRLRTVTCPGFHREDESGQAWKEYALKVLEELALDRLKELRSTVDDQPVAEPLLVFPNLLPRPLLSVCISTYNRAGWLRVNLAQLYTQISDQNDSMIEILVVDNTSTDNTEEIVQPYIGLKNFRYIRNPKNVGMLGNLRVTAHSARGEYVWILGDDDLVRRGGLDSVISAIQSNPGVALIYPNYAYTQEKNPVPVEALDGFLAGCPAVTPATDNEIAKVKDIAHKNLNLFTAIYALIFRRDHALQAYSLDTTGRPFSTMQTAIPTTYYVLHYMMEERAYWIGDPILVVNYNVSWLRYASLFYLERFPEAHDLAERMGADVESLRPWRVHISSSAPEYWKEIYENDPENNGEFFSADRVLMHFKGRRGFGGIVSGMIDTYVQAHARKHPLAKRPPEDLFRAFEALMLDMESRRPLQS